MGRTIKPTPAQAAELFGHEIKLGPAPICTVCNKPAVYDPETGQWYCPANRIVSP